MKQHRAHSAPIQIALCLAHHLSACMVVCLCLSVSLCEWKWDSGSVFIDRVWGCVWGFWCIKCCIYMQMYNPDFFFCTGVYLLYYLYIIFVHSSLYLHMHTSVFTCYGCLCVCMWAYQCVLCVMPVYVVAVLWPTSSTADGWSVCAVAN